VTLGILVLNCALSKVASITYHHDELLYTKQLWDEFKLPFPYSVFREEETVVIRAKEALEGLFVDHSLSPQKDLSDLIEQDIKR